MVSRYFRRVGLCIAHRERFADWSNHCSPCGRHILRHDANLNIIPIDRARLILLLTVDVRSMLD